MRSYTYEEAMQIVDSVIEDHAAYCDEYNRTHATPIMGKYGSFARTILVMAKAIADSEGRPFIIPDVFIDYITGQTATYELWTEYLRKRGNEDDKCGD